MEYDHTRIYVERMLVLVDSSSGISCWIGQHANNSVDFYVVVEDNLKYKIKHKFVYKNEKQKKFHFVEQF